MNTRKIEKHESVQPHHKFVVVAKQKGYSGKSKWYWKNSIKRFLPHLFPASVFTLTTIPESIWNFIGVETPDSEFYDIDIEIVID